MTGDDVGGLGAAVKRSIVVPKTAEDRIVACVVGAPPTSGPVSKAAPSSHKPTFQLAIPGMRELQELRALLATGGLPASDRRTPADDARIAALRAIMGLLQLLRQFKARVESGEACRLVVCERPTKPGRLLIEIAIREEQP